MRGCALRAGNDSTAAQLHELRPNLRARRGKSVLLAGARGGLRLGGVERDSTPFKDIRFWRAAQEILWHTD
jgi:hypothetical protein